MMWDAQVDLVEGLLDVGGDDEDVPGVADGDLLQQVHPDVGAVGVEQPRDAAHALGPEAGAAAVGGAHVERGPDHGNVVPADLVDVLAIRRLQERVDPGELRIEPAGEQRDVAVVDRRRRLQSQIQGPGDQLPALGVGGVLEPASRSHARQPRPGGVEVIPEAPVVAGAHLGLLPNRAAARSAAPRPIRLLVSWACSATPG